MLSVCTLCVSAIVVSTAHQIHCSKSTVSTDVENERKKEIFHFTFASRTRQTGERVQYNTSGLKQIKRFVEPHNQASKDKNSSLSTIDERVVLLRDKEAEAHKEVDYS